MCNRHLEALSTTNNLSTVWSIIKRHHPSVTTILGNFLLCWGSRRQDKEASGGLQDKACHGAEARGGETHLQAVCQITGKREQCLKQKEMEHEEDRYSRFALWQALPQVWRRWAPSPANYPCRSGRRWQEIPWADVTAGFSTYGGRWGGMTRQNITQTMQTVAAHPAMGGNLMGKLMSIRLMMHFREETCLKKEG